MSDRWAKLGRILGPEDAYPGMVACNRSACALQVGDSPLFDLYVTGRDDRNRSLIGRVRIDIRDPLSVVERAPGPVFTCGTPGTFDENGVSYPWAVRSGEEIFLYYTGWMPTVITPFQNQLGLARLAREDQFERVSRAPILPRTDADHLSIGSACVVCEGSLWRMWYTSFTGWGTRPNEPKHRYLIKYAESHDGLTWRREDRVCIDLEHPGEHSISHPSVVRRNGRYHLWYCTRGDEYRLGYAVSADGIIWTRRDDEVGIKPSAQGWDSRSQCYPSVFSYRNDLFMLYCGNEYGRDGLGIAKLVGEL